MRPQQQRVGAFGAAAAPEYSDSEIDMFSTTEDESFDEEKVGELYHFKIKNVPINFQKATNVPFMDDIVNVPYEDHYLIELDNNLAHNREVPANHRFKFSLRYAPPLPR